jgi:hypothetical protein
MNEKSIYTALMSLIGRCELDSFVIFEEPQSGKFVQFHHGPRLQLDVPLVALAGPEADKAHNFLREYGKGLPRSFRRENPDTGESGRYLAFHHDFGRDAHTAAKAVLAFFRTVYDLPSDADISITEN